jgi:hypothetical protein
LEEDGFEVALEVELVGFLLGVGELGEELFYCIHLVMIELLLIVMVIFGYGVDMIGMEVLCIDNK